jgi:hypothetical protein
MYNSVDLKKISKTSALSPGVGGGGRMVSYTMHHWISSTIGHQSEVKPC